MADTQREEIAKLEALYAAHPEGRVFTHLADAYRRAGELSRARDILNDGLRRHPDYSSAHVVLGKVLTDQGEPEAALGAFRRVLELDRHNLVALRAVGDLLVQRGDAASATSYYRDLQSLDPSDEQLRQTLARIEAEGIAAGSSMAGSGLAADAAAGPDASAEYVDAAGAAAVPEAAAEYHAPVEADPAETSGAGWLRAEDAGEGEPRDEGELLAGFESFAADEEAMTEEGADWFAGTSLDAGLTSPQMADEAEDGVDTAGFEVLAGFGWQQDEESSRDITSGGDDVDLASWSFESEAGSETDASTGFGGEADPGVDVPAEFAGEPAEPAWVEPSGEEWSGVVFEDDSGDSEWPEPVESDVAPTPDEAWSRVAAFEASESVGDAEKPLDDAGQAWPDAEDEETATAGGMDEIEAGAVAGSATRDDDADVPPDGEEDAAFQVSRYAAAFLQPAEQPDAGMVTATMADLYARQGFYERAIQVYRQLLEEVPDDERLKERLDEVAALQEASRSEANEGAGEEGEEGQDSADAAWLSGESGVAGAETTPYAWAESAHSDAAGGPTAGAYFAGLLSWRPAGRSPEATEPALLELENEPGVDDLLELGGPEESATGEIELEAGAVAAAFEEWFGAENEAAVEGGDGEGRAQEPEGDADLEMFRSWLQSLKK